MIWMDLGEGCVMSEWMHRACPPLLAAKALSSKLCCWWGLQLLRLLLLTVLPQLLLARAQVASC
jgi:hypothetical protein